MPAGLTVGLLLWAALGAHSPAHGSPRTDSARFSVSVAAFRQAAGYQQAVRGRAVSLRALRALLPHHVLLLELHALATAPPELRRPSSFVLASRPVHVRSASRQPLPLASIRAP
jgi:hypothetical protein